MHRLRARYEPLSYRLLVDDPDSNPDYRDLQEIVEKLVPAVQAMVSHCIEQIKRPSSAANAKATQSATAPGRQSLPQGQEPQFDAEGIVGQTLSAEAAMGVFEPTLHPNNSPVALQPELQTETHKRAQESTLAIPLMQTQPQEPRDRKSNGVSSEVETKPPVQIKISENLSVLTDPPSHESVEGRRAVLALAALSGNGATEYTVDTAKFVSLTHGNDDDIPRDWGKSAAYFRKTLGINVKRECNKEYHLSGFALAIARSVDDAKIKEKLKKLVPKPRGTAPSIS